MNEKAFAVQANEVSAKDCGIPTPKAVVAVARTIKGDLGLGLLVSRRLIYKDLILDRTGLATK